MRSAFSRRVYAATRLQTSGNTSFTRGFGETVICLDDAEIRQTSSFRGFAPDPMDVPLRFVQPLTRNVPLKLLVEDRSKTEDDERVAKARIVFGSRLAGPGKRRSEIEQNSTIVAGVTVPPKPEEPDNCCMSGCVNCVWDLYRDEMEEWAAKSAEARTRLQEQHAQTTSNANKSAAPDSNLTEHIDEADRDSNADLFADIPVGIREFMKTEKKLKQNRKTEPTVT